MSFKVSRVNKPEIITDTFLPYLQHGGELTENDVDQILANADQRSYPTDYTQLCEYIGLWKQVNNRFVYDLDANRLPSDRTERLFQLLARLPHFRRWLLLKYRDEHDPSVEDVTVLDEREQGFLKRRLSMLEKWDDYVRSRISRSMEDLIEEYLPETMRVSDEFLFYDSQLDYTEEAEVRTTLLILLVLAQKRGFAVLLNQVARLLAIELETLHEIIEGVFMPLSIDVDTGGHTAALNSTIQFSITNPDRIEDRLAALNSTENLSEEGFNSYVGGLAGELVNRGVFTTAAVDIDTPRSQLQWQDEQIEVKRYPELPPPDTDTVFEQLWEYTRQSGRVPLPDADFQELGTFNRALAEILTLEDYPSVGTPEWQFLTLIREPEVVLGPAPIFSKNNIHSLTPVGTWLTDINRSTRNLFARTLLFLSHPAYRYLAIVACEFEKFQLDAPYRLNLGGTTYTLPEFFDYLSTSDHINHEFILSESLRQVDCKPVVDTAEWFGFLEPDLAAGTYDIGSDLNRSINKYKFAGKVYEEEYDKLRAVAPGVTL